MPEWNPSESPLPSLLERLTDLEPRNRNEAPPTTAQALRQLKLSLRRDLEWLLNTRRTIHPLPDWCRELPYSLFQYGLPDMTNRALQVVQEQNRLAALLEAAIAVFEPRLKNVSVSLLEPGGPSKLLRFQIEGLLRVEPGPERIQLDTTLELASGSYVVEGDPGAR